MSRSPLFFCALFFRALLFAFFVCVATACDPPTYTPPAASAPAASNVTPAPSTPPSAPQSTEVELLRLGVTSGVKEREPIDALTVAPAGQRVYAHMALRNRTSGWRKVHVSFVVNGSERSDVYLDVGSSWSFRTWGYVTLRPDDRGTLLVVVRGESGAELVRRSLAIQPPR